MESNQIGKMRQNWKMNGKLRKNTAMCFVVDTKRAHDMCAPQNFEVESETRHVNECLGGFGFEIMT